VKVEIGNATLYLGDCMDILPMLDKVDAVITDPPYGLKRFKKGFGTTRFKGHGAEKEGLVWDKTPEKEFFDMLLSKGENSIIWGANNFELPTSEYFLVWDKQQTVDNFASAELAYTNVKVPAKVFKYSIHQHNQIEKSHPTQKPVSLMCWCLSFVPKAESILDPFMGSGTTGVAAIQMGKKFIGIEREPKYFEISCKRIEQVIAQPQLFLHEQPKQIQEAMF
jgi:site-specific DNA-methyltransferase (adenine-specific)/modification methylase